MQHTYERRARIVIFFWAAALLISLASIMSGRQIVIEALEDEGLAISLPPFLSLLLDYWEYPVFGVLIVIAGAALPETFYSRKSVFYALCSVFGGASVFLVVWSVLALAPLAELAFR